MAGGLKVPEVSVGRWFPREIPIDWSTRRWKGVSLKVPQKAPPPGSIVDFAGVDRSPP